MGPHTILDEGIERTLDLVADTAAINAVMPYSRIRPTCSRHVRNPARQLNSARVTC
jgi:hypothetical protein